MSSHDTHASSLPTLARAYPGDRLARLSEPFASVDATSPRTPTIAQSGAGLGLAISFQLTRSLGGTIDVQTGPAGTQMTVTLPLDITMPITAAAGAIV